MLHTSVDWMVDCYHPFLFIGVGGPRCNTKGRYVCVYVRLCLYVCVYLFVYILPPLTRPVFLMTCSMAVTSEVSISTVSYLARIFRMGLSLSHHSVFGIRCLWREEGRVEWGRRGGGERRQGGGRGEWGGGQRDQRKKTGNRGKKTREMLEGTVSNLFKETFDGSKWIGIDFQTTALST